MSNTEECKDPKYTEEYIAPALSVTAADTDGTMDAYITKLQESIASIKDQIAGLQHDVENLTDLMPTIISSYKSSPKPTDVYSASYINSKIGGNN